MISQLADLPKITVITPSYNSELFIEDTIRSVLSQDYPNLEYFVIDGGSSDNTIEILKKYASKLTWISEKDRGQSHAINKGIDMATGEVIAYLNSDDVYLPGAMTRIARLVVAHPQAYWITGRCRFIDSCGVEIRRLAKLYKYFWLLWGNYTVLTVLDYVSQPATFWRRKVFQRVGYFDENLHYAMDYDFSLRVGKVFKMWRINHCIASYRIHSSSKTFSSADRINDQFDEDLEIARKNGTSPALVNLHKLHNGMVKIIYRGMIRVANVPETSQQ